MLAMQSTFIPNGHFVDQLISSRYHAFLSWQRCRFHLVTLHFYLGNAIEELEVGIFMMAKGR